MLKLNKLTDSSLLDNSLSNSSLSNSSLSSSSLSSSSLSSSSLSNNSLFDKSRLIGMLACVGLLTACQTNPQETSNTSQPVTQAPLLADQLHQYNWRLQSAIDGSSNQPINSLNSIKQQVQLNFHANEKENTLGFSVGCNGYGAKYQLNNNREIVTEFIIGTQMYCQHLDKAERKLAQLMTGTSQLSIKSQQSMPQSMTTLSQTTANGSTLIWQGTLTDEAQHGKGETIFLEIAPKMAYCSSGIEQKCLKVRDVYYNDSSIKSGYSNWRLMKHPIEGYTHNSNTRQILRIKKYVTNPVDVKGKQLKYILDMVVESEAVQQ